MTQIIIKALMGILLQLLTSQALTDLFVWAARALAKSTKTDVDDELVAVIEKALKVPPQEPVGK